MKNEWMNNYISINKLTYSFPMKSFYNPEFGLITKKNLLQTKSDVCRFYFRRFNSIRICIVAHNIILSAVKYFLAIYSFTGMHLS